MKKTRRKNSFLELIGGFTLFLIVIYCGIQLMGSAVFSDKENNETENSHNRKTITVEGVDYFPKQDITVLLVMGIDEEGKVQSSGSYNNRGEADVIELLIFDETERNITILNINRDTMVNMPVLGLGGKKAGERYGQIALSHTYGNGLEESCENTKETVSKLFNNLYIDYYLAANMDAIAIGNDAIGGVTVNVIDDFSQIDETIPLGKVTLRGQQAVSYVRMRKDVGDQLNLSRMERHREYISGFMEALEAKRRDGDSFIYGLYEEISPYVVTDLSANILSVMFSRYEDYELKDIVTLKGENVLGEKFMEYYLDEEAFKKLVIDLFYREKAF